MKDQFEDLKSLLGEDHVKDVADLSAMLQKYHAAREAEYDRSFAKRGLAGVWCNLGRKFDAIDNAGNKGKLVSVIALDHLVDVALYALKFVVVLASLAPKVWDEWHERVYMPAVKELDDSK